ncbi:hypothetical protein BJV82DRAFT_614167 [Fennellomyces sp. T-0311]|nr:hypothetical protein BJV82DRAFT_614167 [Fennellomyces sp. T-0311]
MMVCLNQSTIESPRPPEMEYIHPTDTSTLSAATRLPEKPLRHPVIDLSALAQYTEQSAASTPSKRTHQRQAPSIDVTTCKRKLSLYGDNQTQVVPFQQHAEQTVYYYHPETGHIQADTLLNLQHPSFSLQDLLTKENYWIDITAPSVAEMKVISKVFRIHPLSTEDILSQETREKCDVFRTYLFICYRAFVHDGHVLRPVSFYNIIHKRSILTFHFSNVPQLQHVYQRVEQLQDYIVVAPDWINYAILDVITDQFAPLIHQIEADVDAIDDPAMLLQVKDDETEMVLRIGSCRKRVMQMHRLLNTKADVVRALIKRLDDTAAASSANISPANSTTTLHEAPASRIPCYHHRRGGSSSSLGYIKSPSSRRYTLDDDEADGDKIFPDVALYLGDVQDHLITMLQNLSHYETVLARAHSNYLAQISIKLSQTSNSTNYVIGRLTVFATILMPMNLVTGLWGMNVKVPGKDYDDLLYFFWIVSSLAVFAIGAFTLARRFQFF